MFLAFLNFYRTAIFSKRGVDVTLRRDGMTAPAAKVFSPAAKVFSPAAKVFTPAAKVFTPAAKIFTLTAKIFTLGLEKPKPNPVSVTTV